MQVPPPPREHLPNRIVVYGVTGSGKTTLARRIADAFAYPFVEVDSLTWEPQWKEVSLEDQRCRIQAVCDTDRWILDTMYAKWKEIPLARAELIIGLDYPRWTSFCRLLTRTISRAQDKQKVCGDNVESWHLVFSRQSILIWHFRSFAHKRRRIWQWANSAGGPAVVVFQSPKDVESWLTRLSP